MTMTGDKAPGALDAVLAAMRDRLELDPQQVEALSVTAWNQHFSLYLEREEGLRRHHLVIYTLPDPTAIAGLQFEHAILRHLEGQSFPQAPLPVVVDGESLFAYEGGWFAITDWIEGCRAEDDPPVSGRQVETMAQGLAALHEAFRGLELHLDYHPDHVFVYPAAAFLDAEDELIERLRGKLADFGPEATAAWERSEATARRVFAEMDRERQAAVAKAERDAGLHIVHGDFRPLNAAFEGEQLRAILDFNCCYNEPRLWDVAYTALGLGGDEVIGRLQDLERPAAFIAAYHAVSPLSDDERALLPAYLSFLVAKLMVGAFADWCVTRRAEMLATLAGGGAEEICRRAGL